MVTHQLLRFAFIACLGPVALNLSAHPDQVMLFDVSRVPDVPELIVREATRQGVPAHLAIMVAWRESKFNPLAIGTNFDGSHDYGLFQLSERTVKILHVARPLDARQSTIGGVGVLRWGLDLCGSERGALSYYASGYCRANSRLER